MSERTLLLRGLLLALLATGPGCATGSPSNPGTPPEIDAQGEEPDPGPATPARVDAAAPATTPTPKPDDTPPATAPDAASGRDPGPTPTTPPDGGAPVPPAADGDYACTMLIGINATAEWYNQGFEKLVDDGRWELIRVHSGFVNLWADPNNGVWSAKPSSACAKNATNPDRVIFVALEFDYTTLEQWLPNLTAVVKNLQTKYSNVKRIELATFVRAPMNKPCPQREPKRSTIAPAEDQAIEMVAKSNPGLVIVSPKFEALTCSEFSGNPPHPTAAGGAAWAKRIAEHYGVGR